MPFGSHRSRVPAMLAVACAGMLVYAVAWASPDGTQLAPVSCAATPSGAPAPGCTDTTMSVAAKGDSPAAVAADKGSGGATTPTTKCDTPPTTGKGGNGSTTTTTGKGGNGSTTTTTDKGSSGSTTTTTGKGGNGSTTTTTDKGSSGSTTSTTGKGSSGSTTTTTGKNDSTAAGSGGGSAGTASGSSGDPNASSAASGGTGSVGTPAKDCGTTTTTGKGGKNSTTTTTGKGGKNSTTTTTGKGGKNSTTTTTAKSGGQGGGGSTPPPSGSGGTVSPSMPGGSTNPGSASDPGTPIQIQEFPGPSGSDQGPAAGPEAANAPGSVDFPVGPGGGVGVSGGDVPVAPLAVPGAGPLPVFGDLFPAGSGGVVAKAASGSRSRTQELASASFGAGTVSDDTPPTMTQSGSVSRSLAGLQSSVTESAFPARIISTPKVFPINHRDPLAAAALVLILGVGREIFKAWRRKANESYWPA